MLKLIIALLIATPVFAQFNDVQRQEMPFQNLVLNGGAENGKAKMTASGGSFAAITTAEHVGKGRAAFQFDASATGQYLTSTAVTIPTGLYGRSGAARCIFKTAATDYKLQVYDGSAVLSEVTIPASTNYAPGNPVNFVFPSSGSISIRIASQSDAATLYIDDCFLGDAFNLTQVSQATLYGSITYAGATNCIWVATTPTSYANYGADTDCATPTVTGAMTAPGTKIPGGVLSSMPPGEYFLVANSMFVASTGTASGGTFRFSDGTNVTNGVQLGAFGGTSPSISTATISGRLSISTAQSNVTIQVQGATGSGNSEIRANAVTGQTAGFELLVYRFPTTSEQAIRIENAAQSWSGYHGGASNWGSITSASPVDTADNAAITLTEATNRNFGTVATYGAAKPGIVFTPKQAGRYLICAQTQTYNTAGGSVVALQLTDGTSTITRQDVYTIANAAWQQASLCGIWVATSTAQASIRFKIGTTSGTAQVGASYPTSGHAIDWTVVAIDQALPAPYLVGGLSTSSAGQERIERAVVNASTCNGAGAGLSDNTPGISNCNNTGSNGNVDVNFTAGTFSSRPVCSCTTTGNNGTCSQSGSWTTTLIHFIVRDTASTPTNGTVAIQCMGPR